MTALLALPILLPLVGAGCSMIVGRSRAAQRAVSLTVLTAVVGVAVTLLIAVDRDGPVAVQAGGWAAPMGITLVADRLSALMLAVASVMLLAVLVYAIGQPGAERNHVGFQSVYLVLSAGVAGAFLTGDLFNLFVSFEMMLAASYVLITLGARRDQVRAGMTYVVISLIASTLFVTALAFVYSATGTVNLAHLSERMEELSPGLNTAFSVLLLVVFGIKAGLFPLFFWLPDSYPTAPSAVTAVFAGLLTKVGVYAIIRSQSLLFPPDSRPSGLILVMAGATMAVGVLGAIAQDDVKRILSFHIVSHVGFMVMGLGFFTVAGLGGAVFYIVHHIIVMTTLFLTGGLVEHVGGSSRLSRLGGLVGKSPVVSLVFLVSGLSLAGLPPFSGFVAKLGLLQAGAAASHHAIVAVALVVSLLTLFSMMKIWSAVFWGTPRSEPEVRSSAPPLMLAPTLLLAVASIVVSVAAGPLAGLSERAAQGLLDRSAYVTAVLR